MSKRKKANPKQTPPEMSSFENSSVETNLELDIKALRIKNGKLVQTVAKLQSEKTQQQAQIAHLQDEYFKLNSTNSNLKNILANIDVSVRAELSKLVEISDMFSKVAHLCSIAKQVAATKDPRTQAVQPHAVNGHVLQHPTISLPRLNNMTGNITSAQSDRNPVTTQENLLDTPETSVNQNGRTEETQDLFVDNGTNDQTEYDVERIVYRRRRNVSLEPLNIEELQQDEEEIVNEEDIDNNTEYRSRLFTIREEEEESHSPMSTIITREVRVYIDRLPSDYVRNNVPRRRNSSIHSFSNNTEVKSCPDSFIRKSFNHSRQSDCNQRHTNSDCNQENAANGDCNSMSRREAGCSGGSGSSFLDNSTASNATVIQETVFRRKMSPLKRREARYFGEPSTFLQSTNGSTGTTFSSLSTLQNDNMEEVPNNISAIPNVPSCSMSHLEDNSLHSKISDRQCSKIILFNTLGLSPSSTGLATSTPVVLNPRLRSRECRVATLNSSTPKKNESPLSKENKKRGRPSVKNKIAQVVLSRMSLDKTSPPGSPVQNIADSLNVPVITRSSLTPLNKKKRYVFSSSSSSNSSSSCSSDGSNSESKENVDTSNKSVTVKRKIAESLRYSTKASPLRLKRKKITKLNTVSSSSSSSTYHSDSSDSDYREDATVRKKATDKVLTPKRSVDRPPKKDSFRKPVTIGSSIRYSQSPKFRSPRPKRAARPTTLKEPTLNKKMRRNK